MPSYSYILTITIVPIVATMVTKLMIATVDDINPALYP